MVFDLYTRHTYSGSSSLENSLGRVEVDQPSLELDNLVSWTQKKREGAQDVGSKQSLIPFRTSPVKEKFKGLCKGRDDPNHGCMGLVSMYMEELVWNIIIGWHSHYLHKEVRQAKWQSKGSTRETRKVGSFWFFTPWFLVVWQ